MTPNALLFAFGGICSGVVAACFLAKWYWSDRQRYDMAWAVALGSNAVSLLLLSFGFAEESPLARQSSVPLFWIFVGALAYGNFEFGGKGPRFLPIATVVSFLAIASLAIDLAEYNEGRIALGVTAGAAYIWTGWVIRRLPTVGHFAALAFIVRGVCVVTLTLLPSSIDRSWLNLFSNATTLVSGLLLVLGSLLLSRQVFQKAQRELCEAHRALLRSNEQLEAQAVELTAAAVKNGEALRRAEAANIAKRNFIANMNHELRTPLNAVMGFTDLLKYKTNNSALHELHGYAENAHAAGAAMLHKISRILDFVAIGNVSDDTQLAPFKAAAVVVEELTCLMESADPKQLTFARNLDHGLVLQKGEAQFRAIIRELVQNAIKVAPAGSEIACNLRSDGGSVLLEIKDQGDGLPGEFIKTVGESFNVSEPVFARGGTQGVGLGLAIASRHAELMGGSLRLERNTPRGTAAIVELPFAEQPASNA